MATWTQREITSGWNKTYEPICNIEERNIIEKAFNTIINNPELMILGRLKDDLQELWNKTEITCDSPDYGTVPDIKVTSVPVNKFSISVIGEAQPSFKILLLKTLVTELTKDKGTATQTLDVEAALHACFQTQNTIQLTTAQLNTMRGNTNQTLIHGEYCMWDWENGKIFDKIVSSGGWGNQSISQGTLCFQHNGFIY